MSKVIFTLFSLTKKDTLFEEKQSEIILKISFLSNGKTISLKSTLFSYV